MASPDTGTYRSPLDARKFIATPERRPGRGGACPTEIAVRLGYIDVVQLARLIVPLAKTEYGCYLRVLLSGQQPTADADQ